MGHSLLHLWRFVLLIVLVFLAGCEGRTGNPAHFTNALPAGGIYRLDYHLIRTFADYNPEVCRVYEEEVWHRATQEFCIQVRSIDRLENGRSVPCPLEEIQRHQDQMMRGEGRYAVLERGFRIRDPQRFLENYNYLILDARARYLGRDALIVQVDCKYEGRPDYKVWIDKYTGFILKYIERTNLYDPLTVMEVIELDLSPDFAGIEMQTARKMDVQPLEGETDSEVSSFTSLQPLYLPPGFQVLPPRLVKINENLPAVLRQEFNDGIHRIMIAQYPIGPGTGLGGLLELAKTGRVDLRSWPGLPIIASTDVPKENIGSEQDLRIEIWANLSLEEVGTMIQSLVPRTFHH